nr:MAG TPA: hypothetical protein [Caudoviricetes sp.]
MRCKYITYIKVLFAVGPFLLIKHYFDSQAIPSPSL